MNSLVGKLMCGVFILVGLALLVLLPGRHLANYIDTQSWQATDAFVMTAKVKSRITKKPEKYSRASSGYKHSQNKKSQNKKMTMYRPDVEFRYEYADQQYVSTSKKRESTNPEYAQTLVAEMKIAQKNQTPITVFVNPNNPRQAVIVRSISWLPVLIGGIFGGLFILIPAAILWYLKD